MIDNRPLHKRLLGHLRQLIFHPKTKIERTYWNLKHGLKNLYRWIPIIWKDRNYDHFHLFRILHFKIKLIRQHLEEYQDSIVFNRGEIEKIKEVENRLEAYVEDDYKKRTGHDKVYEKYGDCEMNFEPIEGNEEFSTVNFTWTKAQTPEENAEASRLSNQAFAKEDELKQQDIEYALEQIKKYYRLWWT